MVDHLQQQEALSLCDLLLDDHDSSTPSQPHRSSSDRFEFFIAASKMSPADDIILSGKLVPFKDHRSPPPPPPAAALRKRSESLSDLPSRVAMSRSNSTAKAKVMMRNSRSLDYRKLQRSPTSAEIRSIPSASTAKPRWYLLMFGIVKIPPAMELRNMKSRQGRRSPSAIFPPAEPEHSRSAWGLLRALSCKDHTSVAATTPFNRMSLA